MTDDLDRRIRKIVAEAFRMMRGNTTDLTQGVRWICRDCCEIIRTEEEQTR